MTINYKFLDIAPGGRMRYLNPAPQWPKEAVAFNTINKLGGNMEQETPDSPGFESDYDKIYAIGEAHQLAGEIVKEAATYLGTIPKDLILDAVQGAYVDLKAAFEGDS